MRLLETRSAATCKRTRCRASGGAATGVGLRVTAGADDQQVRALVSRRWLLRHVDAQKSCREPSRAPEQAAQTSFRAPACVIAGPGTHLHCADRESAPTGVLAEIPLAIASKRNSPALGPGFRFVATAAVSTRLPLFASSGSPASMAALGVKRPRRQPCGRRTLGTGQCRAAGRSHSHDCFLRGAVSRRTIALATFQSLGGRKRACDDLIVEVLDYLVGMRPLLGRDDEIDVTATEAIQRPLGDATGINTQLTEPIPPCHGGCLLLERAHGLPAL